MAENKRIHYLDNIRWVITIVVMLYHVFYMYADGLVGTVGKITNQNVPYQDGFQYAVYPWLMPIFFIVSGISAKLYLDHHTAKEFAKDRTRRLLIPTTLGLIAFEFVQGILNMQLSDAYETMTCDRKRETFKNRCQNTCMAGLLICNPGVGSGTDFKHSDYCGIPSRLLSGILPFGILCFLK